MIAIESPGQFDEALSARGKWLMFVFFQDSTPAGRKLVEELSAWERTTDNVIVHSVDFSMPGSIPARFGITSVPAVLIFRNGEKVSITYGHQSFSYYEKQISDSKGHSSKPGKRVATDRTVGSDKAAHRVIVFTSDHCGWCTKAKDYLRSINVPFKEINVSRNNAEARRMVKRSGQMSTPQLDINGKIVVGFDKVAIDRLLGRRG